MSALKISTLKITSKAERVDLDLLRNKYGIPEDWIDEIKEKWKLDESTGYYYKPGGKYDFKGRAGIYFH